MSHQFLIGNLAREAGINDKTTRCYEDTGILPEPERLENDHLVYDENGIQCA